MSPQALASALWACWRCCSVETVGAWDVGPFENDAALDFVGELVQADGVEALELTLARLDADGAFDDAEIALAAAEIVAAARGHGVDGLPDEVREWLERTKPTFSDQRAHHCRVLVRTIGSESELRELWEDADEFEEWLLTLEDLDTRLGLPAKT